MKNYNSTVLQGIVFITVLLVTTFYLDSKSKDNKEVTCQRNDLEFDKRRSEEAAQFLLNAAEINLEGIRLGKLAQQKGKINNIKELGRMMESEHIKSTTVLNALVKTKNITLPTSQTESGQNAFKKLSYKSGIDFDKAYADMMVSEHKDAISLFETASMECIDPEIRTWASESLPALRINLEHSIISQKKCNKM